MSTISSSPFVVMSPSLLPVRDSSVFSMPVPCIAPDAELEQVAQLAVSLSGRLARLHLHDITSAISEVLEQIAAAMGVDRCELLEFTVSEPAVRTQAEDR